MNVLRYLVIFVQGFGLLQVWIVSARGSDAESYANCLQQCVTLWASGFAFNHFLGMLGELGR